MAVVSSAVIVGTTPTELTVSGGSDGDTFGTNAPGSGLAVDNIDGTATVYVGGADVTTSNGYPVRAGRDTSFDFEQGERMFAIVASGTQTIRTLRLGVKVGG